MIEHAPFEAGMDIMAGAELRRLGNLVEIANTLPVWERLPPHPASTGSQCRGAKVAITARRESSSEPLRPLKPSST